MQTITDIIQPISLLAGSHKNTATTGQGCFMNVIAYLNGESQITDSSPCVCITIRRISIWINDYMNDNERNALLPFVQRAMGTATDDKKVIKARLVQVVIFAYEIAAIVQKYATTEADAKASYACAYATATNAYAYVNATCAATNAAANANYAANCAANVANANYANAARNEIIDRTLAFLDAVCPPADQPSQELIDRANKLIALGVQ